MKKLLVLFAIALTLASCKSKQSTSKIIPDYDSEYNYNSTLVINSPQSVIFRSKIIPQIKREIIKNLGMQQKDFILKFRIYINEKGKLDYIRFINEPKFIKDKPDFENKILNSVKNIPLVKVTSNNKPVKSAFEIVVKKGDSIDTSEFMKTAEKMPSPVGGIAALAKNIVYPEKAKEAGIEGRVYVKAWIDENGNVVKTEVLKGIGYGCDSSAVAAVSKLKFVPGKNHGKPVKTEVVIPVMFKLQ
jgi:TonB family protein